MEAKEIIQGLSDTELHELLTWLVHEELEDRKVRARSSEVVSSAEVKQIQSLRNDGLLTTPEPMDEFLPGEVYLPGETAVHGKDVWVVVCDRPTRETPGEGSDWTVVPKEEPVANRSVVVPSEEVVEPAVEIEPVWSSAPVEE